jgi:nucleoside-diphosphate-sugar epimerase
VPTTDATGPVLITGGTGFIGVHVARALLDGGRDVRLLDIAPPTGERAFVLGEHEGRLTDELVTASVDDWSAVLDTVRTVRPSAIVHIAAIVSPVVLAERPNLALQVNLGGTVNVLEAARMFNVRRTVVFSSIGVLPKVQYEPIDVNHPVLLADEGPGAGFYGAAKIGSEAFCHAYRQCFGLDVRIVRPSAVYGLGMNFPIYVKPMVDAALAGRPVAFPSGGAVARDYTHVSDLASLAIAVLDGPDDADATFFGATGEPLVSATEVAELLRELVPGAEIDIPHGVSDADRYELRFRGRLSIENARAQLGWAPRYPSIRDGLAEYVAGLRSYLAAQQA